MGGSNCHASPASQTRLLLTSWLGPVPPFLPALPSSAQRSGMANGLTHLPVPDLVATAAALTDTGTNAQPRSLPNQVPVRVVRMNTRTFCESGMADTYAS